MEERSVKDLEREIRDLKAEVQKLEADNKDAHDGMVYGALLCGFAACYVHALLQGLQFVGFVGFLLPWMVAAVAIVIIGFVATAVIRKKYERLGRIVAASCIVIFLLFLSWASLSPK